MPADVDPPTVTPDTASDSATVPGVTDPLTGLYRAPAPAPAARFRDWAESFDLSPWRLLAGAVALVALGLAGWRLLAPEPPPPEMRLPMVSTGETGTAAGRSQPATTGQQDAAAAPAGDGRPAEVVVHVAGAVEQPGVQQLDPAARVIDAVDAAGGATGDADMARINLAATLQDGQRIYLPATGEDPPPLAGGLPAGAAGEPSGEGPATAEVVDVNTAGPEALETLPGVGPVTARAIVDHRAEHGPFTVLEQLKDVRGIGDAKLEDLRAHAAV